MERASGASIEQMPPSEGLPTELPLRGFLSEDHQKSYVLLSIVLIGNEGVKKK